MNRKKAEDGGSLSERFGNPLEWSSVDKGLLTVVMSLPFPLTYMLLAEYFIDHPEVAPYLNPRVLRTGCNLMALTMAWWIVALFVGLWLRKRHPDNRLYSHLSLMFWCAATGFFMYAVGPFTSPVLVYPLIAGVFGYLLFDNRAVMWGGSLLVLVFLVSTVASFLGIIPYAPILDGPPFIDERISGWWVAAIGVPSLSLIVGTTALFFYTIRLWRKRESELITAHEELRASKESLARSADFIKRYIPGQLAEEILSGKHRRIGVHERRKLTRLCAIRKGRSGSREYITR